MKVYLRYNAPATLTFSLVCTFVLVIDMLTPGNIQLTFFSVGPGMNPRDPLDWLRLVSHVLGHGNIEHLFGNLSFILLLGPILEEKYGSKNILIMICITALATGLASILFSKVTLLGASGVVFMMILLASFTNVGKGDLPLSFVLVVIIYLLREFLAAFHEDSISQLAHIVGGVIGSIFGFIYSFRIPSGSSKGDSSGLATT